MESLLHMAGYIISVLAAAGIVAGIEALNERMPYGPGRAGAPLAGSVAERRRGGPGGLRQAGS